MTIRTPTIKERLVRLLEQEDEKLTTWEKNFLANCQGWLDDSSDTYVHTLSHKQMQILEKIENSVINK